MTDFRSPKGNHTRLHSFLVRVDEVLEVYQEANERARQWVRAFSRLATWSCSNQNVVNSLIHHTVMVVSIICVTRRECMQVPLEVALRLVEREEMQAMLQLAAARIAQGELQ